MQVDFPIISSVNCPEDKDIETCPVLRFLKKEQNVLIPFVVREGWLDGEENYECACPPESNADMSQFLTIYTKVREICDKCQKDNQKKR